MDDITLLEECVVKVEEIKEEYCHTFENARPGMLKENSEEVNDRVTVLLEPKEEIQEAEGQEIEPITVVYLFPKEEEQLEDDLAVDPLAGCEEWNEKMPPADSLPLRVKTEISSEQAVFEEMKDEAEDASGSNRAESVSEEQEASTSENENIVTHTNRRTFVCAHCSKTFQYKKSLEEHELEHQKEPQLLSFDMFQQQFTSRKTILGHIRLPKNKAKFPCEKEFSSARIYKINPYECRKCGKTFGKCSEYEVHMRIHPGEKPHFHTEDRPYKCRFCCMTFVHKGTFNYHLMSTHGQRPYKCNFCDATFTQRSHCLYHEMTHSERMGIKCKECGKVFLTTGIHKQHMRSHTTEKPFKCAFCEQTFEDSSNYMKHEVTHTKVYAFNCSECGKGYSAKKYLVRHILTHGNQ